MHFKTFLRLIISIMMQPGFDNVVELLPERTTLQRNMKKHLLDGKKFGIAKGHLKVETAGDRVLS